MEWVPVLLLQWPGRIYHTDVDACHLSSLEELCAEVPGRLRDACNAFDSQGNR